ncbi:MAG: hypothetical protein ACRDQ5_06400 [Sciscionella sp.]
MTETLSREFLDECEWSLCPQCRGLVYDKRLVRNLRVCPECGAHHRIPAHERIAQLFDDGSIELLAPQMRDTDPLGFVDTVPYPARLVAARDATGLDEAVVLAAGTIEGNAVTRGRPSSWRAIWNVRPQWTT